MKKRMRAERLKRMAVRLGIAAILLGIPASSGCAFGAGLVPQPQASSEASLLLEQDQSAQPQGESEQAKRDREQHARDREQHARDREQEKKDAEQARTDRMQGLYDRGRELLDENRYADAAKKFSEMAKMVGAQVDAALYWTAYADNKLGKREAAFETIADLKQRFPQ